MKLESAAVGGSDTLNLQPKVKGEALDTTFMVSEVFDTSDRYSARELAYSAESYITRGLAMLAVEEAERLGVKAVGLSGGVAYNEHIATEIGKIATQNSLAFYVHRDVPPGDGGTSFGQAAVAARLSVFR